MACDGRADVGLIRIHSGDRGHRQGGAIWLEATPRSDPAADRSVGLLIGLIWPCVHRDRWLRAACCCASPSPPPNRHPVRRDLVNSRSIGGDLLPSCRRPSARPLLRRGLPALFSDRQTRWSSYLHFSAQPIRSDTWALSSALAAAPPDIFSPGDETGGSGFLQDGQGLSPAPSYLHRHHLRHLRPAPPHVEVFRRPLPPGAIARLTSVVVAVIASPHHAFRL